MNTTNPRVDGYFSKARKWREESLKLREILLGCHLTEELKWDKPCYGFQNSNVVIIQEFKEYCALLFFKGVLLKDPDGILVKTGENTRVGRQIRFTSPKEIVKPILRAYIQQAIEIEKAGLKVSPRLNAKLEFPQEFISKLDESPAFKAAFEALTPGRQRAYNFYFSAPKQSKTRTSRIEKCMPLIFDGRGLNDY